MSDHSYSDDTDFPVPIPVPIPLATPTRAPAPAATRTSAAATRSIARRAISKYAELAECTEDHLFLLAAAFGTQPDEVEIAVTIVSSPRSSVGAIADILTLHTHIGNVFGLFAAAAGLNRDEGKRVWALLTYLEHATGALPIKDAVAAAAIAEAINALTPENITNLSAARVLGSK